MRVYFWVTGVLQPVWAAIINSHRLGGLETTGICFSRFWRLKSKSQVPTDSESGEGFLVPRPGLSVCPHGGRGEGALWGLLDKGISLFHSGSAQMT